ncbi:hypothetical protein ANO11243_090030 [Dothideomycetidae sp. 11243]|nr:hypothetical protein ANO11243_090030 [fungal sp. No.11243]
MSDIYQLFLRSPDVSHLAPSAALHYITTTSTIKDADAIVKHLQAQEQQVQKKEEKILSCISSDNGVCAETETTFVFRNGGGLILPNMDENMLADVTAVCPMVHIVSLDSNGKISQIRLYWDQSTMLKQVDAIGKTGRNWPIRDGKEQAKLMKRSIESPASPQGNGQSAQSAGNGRMPDEYTSRLFATGTNEPRGKFTSTVDPRESAKPQQRQWGELFPGGEEGDTPESISSPSVRNPHMPNIKSGAGQNFQPNRLFDENKPSEREQSPQRKQQDPTKHDHFEFGNGEDALPVRNQPFGRGAQKQNSNWDFDDFNTPAKPVSRPNREQERHIGYGIDEEAGPTPAKRPVVHAPRPDAKTNFEITDENTPEAQGKRPLKTETNINSARRHADHDPHFNLRNTTPGNENAPAKAVSNVTKARSDMESSWNFGQMQEEETQKSSKIYKTAGDGMGGRAGTRFWDVAGDDAPEQYGGQGGQKQVYKTAGNGMGGRKGQGLGWSIGDPDAM